MNNNSVNWIANFIWGIADDVLRDVYVRGKYRDVILPMIIIRRLDAVLDMKKRLDDAGISSQATALCQASCQAFYNDSPFTLRDLRACAKAQQLKAFPIYLPEIDEQQKILNHIAQESSSLDVAITGSRKEIDFLREYRTRLIADVVTGKLDMHGVEMPALDESEALDDLDTVESTEIGEGEDLERLVESDV